MPFLSLNTNIDLDDSQAAGLLEEMTQVIKTATGKSERYIMTEVESSKLMMFAGSTDPLAYLECKSIGLTPTQAKNLSASISQLLQSELKIPAERIYIEFSNCPAELWGWNGNTFG